MNAFTRLGVAIMTILMLASCAIEREATPKRDPGLPDLAPGERPAANTDEAGFWMLMDELENDLRNSGRLLDRPEVTEYVRGVACRLARDSCRDIRVYVIHRPGFHATMPPNGAMQISSGLFLRLQNEAQLAYILGHELGHFLRRHGVQHWRYAKSKSNLALEDHYAFSREQEREADEIGCRLVAEAGYDPRQAVSVWQGTLREEEAGSRESKNVGPTSHLAPAERVATLASLADRASMHPDHGGTVGREPYLAVTLPLRRALLEDELSRREYAEMQVVLDRLIEGGVRLGEVHFFQGELYRRRAHKGDTTEAIAAYERALEAGDAPPETFRGLALCYAKLRHFGTARAMLDRYLALRPDAPDRDMLEIDLKAR
jgi:hypothetical protein